MTAPTKSRNGWRRTAIYLRAVVDLDLAGVGFSLGANTAEPLRFIPATQPPSLVDNAVAGTLAVAWLERTKVLAGQRILLGYVDTPAAAARPAFFGESANATIGGREVRLSPSTDRVNPR